jgi:hypothetical protein
MATYTHMHTRMLHLMEVFMMGLISLTQAKLTVSESIGGYF